MLRQVAKPMLGRRLVGAAITTPKSRESQRLYAATSREKRSLNKAQLEGTADAAAAPKAGAEAPVPPPPPTQGGSGSSLPLVLAVVAAGGAGAAYYQGLIPGLSPHPDEAPEQSTDEPKAEQPADSPQPQDEVKPETPSVASKQEVSTDVDNAAAESGNRVVSIALPEGSTKSDAPAAASDHPEGGNKVAMLPSTKSVSEPINDDDDNNKPTVDAALQELQSELSRETSQSLKLAHEELAKINALNLSDLDTLSMTELKIRLVQMARDLEDRTKWEAVRLKEFLAMKEKEVEDKYVILLKRQRLEAETNMEHKLREQQMELTLRSEKLMHEKEQALQAIVENSLKIQEQQFNDEKSDFQKQTEEAMSAKYEELYGKSLAEAKQAFAQKMEQKVQQIEALAKKLSDLEFALQNTKSFQSGSVQAHRMSAAALSLIDKLESSKPAGAAVAALQAVSEDNSVVRAALAALPKSVASSGIATFQELQTSFEEQVYKKCRQAALVPVGRKGLEGQLLGMAFATLKFPPGPDDVAPESEKDASEYVLARARRHIQMGELEQAVEQMEKLTGQAGFVAKDWTQKAKDRVNVENALKVIRLECALANESMSNASAN